MKKFSFPILLFVFSYSSAQNLAAYSDFRNHFLVWDKGNIRELEYLPVKSFQVGKSLIAYEDNSGNLKVYCNGMATKVSSMATAYFTSGNLTVWLQGSALKVFENGKIFNLCFENEEYYVGDSVVFFIDRMTKYSNVFYNGQIFELEDQFAGHPGDRFKVGKNIVAYVNHNNEFKIFYHGVPDVLLNNNVKVSYETGLNIVAFWDNPDLSFRVFYKGTIYELEVNRPKSFRCGDDLAAYVDNTGALKIFYEGEVRSITDFRPDFYEVVDSMVIFSENKIFKCFTRGNVYILANNVPSVYKAHNNTVAWLDETQLLNCFYGGTSKIITYDKIKWWDLFYNIIAYTTDGNENRVFIRK